MHPPLRYTIIHNKKIVSTHKSYVVYVMRYTDTGFYKCTAKMNLQEAP